MQSAIAQDPDNTSLLFAVANTQIRWSEFRRAAQLLRELTSSRPDHVLGWNNLAAVLIEIPEANLQEALAAADNALLAAGEEEPRLLDTKALVLMRMGKNRGAANLLQQVVNRAEGRDPRWHLHLAAALLKVEDRSAARQAWIESLEQGVTRTFLTGFERRLAEDLQFTFGQDANVLP